eukprot:CAMPEP_0115573274 /NCGR_PEP_ID=MMETSP0272-20121206/915_1 /TAXON_ID=71861 /ORGANISM="Scrippsiella trochoidea, Strain CCMP3099" /LENGTH=221 /DNA_ID=CAMNT_0003007935 /DNA_START=1 /DNA_END=663 /DNA_ORIENTATION=+
MFDFRTASVPKSQTRFIQHSPRDVLHTPPREDPATRPRTVINPHDDLEHEHPHRTATKQAVILTCTFFVVFMFVTSAGYGLYVLAGVVLGKNIELDCPGQPIENGLLKAGPWNSSAIVKCNPGYSMRGSLDFVLQCTLIHEDCVVLKRATMQREARRRCKRHFAYIRPEKAVDPHQDNTSIWMPKATEAYLETKGVCTLDALAQTQSFFKEGVMMTAPAAR